MHFRNSRENEYAKRRLKVATLRAFSDGVFAFHAGLDALQDNPYRGWQRLPTHVHSNQCLLFCRWLAGWLQEHERSQT